MSILRVYNGKEWIILKGIDGKTPVKGIDYFDGVKGDTVFVEKVIVEKHTETVREQPIIQPIKETTKEIIKEISAPPVEGPEIVSKINGLPISPEFQIDAKHIKDLPLFTTRQKLRGGGDTIAAGSGITITTSDGIKTISSSISGFSKLTPTGDVDGSNQSFVFSSAPSVIVVDGMALQQTSSNGFVNWTGTTTVTMTIAPTTDIYGY